MRGSYELVLSESSPLHGKLPLLLYGYVHDRSRYCDPGLAYLLARFTRVLLRNRDGPNKGTVLLPELRFTLQTEIPSSECRTYNSARLEADMIR